ncbi:unnamed protein product [Owenia fusiformis]|nr:unnamed protein product [Owenia fusiformis]
MNMSPPFRPPKYVVGPSIVVNTSNGALQGQLTSYRLGTFAGAYITEFLGIPYAAAPTGKMRWVNPQKQPKWQGIKQVTQYGSSCMQESEYLDMSEDCLYLNVWIPGNWTGGGNLSVMVWIHGGGFQTGSSTIYDSGYLSQHANVLIVTINYRLNVFGFLSTESGPDDGNWGLKDMVLALQWVQENIGHFGGDKNSVTIFGESAGSAAVTMLMISNQAKGLFQKAIAQSGSLFDPWAMNPKGKNREMEEKLVYKLKCDFYADLNCLRTRTASDVLSASMLMDLRFVPNMDGSFFADDPKTILERGQYEPVDFVNGCNSHEGFMSGPEISSRFGDLGLGYNMSQFKAAISMDINKTSNYSAALIGALSLIYNNYSTDESMRSTDRSKGVIDATTDHSIIAGTHQFATLYKKHSPKKVYCYYLHVQLSKAIRIIAPDRPDWVNSVHADDIPFVFGTAKYILDLNVTEGERRLSNLMMQSWGEFARTGSPSLKYLFDWPEFTDFNSNYLEFNNSTDIVPKYGLIKRFLSKRMNFWIDYVYKDLGVPLLTM